MGTDPRHARRISLMQALFAYSFPDAQHQRDVQLDVQHDHPDIAALIAQLPEIDALLTRHAPERPLSEINKVDLAILRTIMFEWNSAPTPKKVLIDEAVELAKEFGSDTSSKFVNGVLAKIYCETQAEA